jgi:thiol-disulfide isomerase/thioredoxin
MYMLKKILKHKQFRTVVLIAAILIIGVIGYKVSFKCLAKYEGLEGGEKTLVLLHMTGCGHCDTLMPKWDAAAKENDNTKIKMVKYEKDEPLGKKLNKLFNVQGFPTIILMGPGDKELDRYSGGRTKEDILSYLKQQSS